MDSHGIFIELYTGNYVMCMTGIGNTQKDMKSLLNGLSQLRESIKKEDIPVSFEQAKFKAFGKADVYPIPANKFWRSLDEAAGSVCASSLIPYPPGIPLVCPGEKLTGELIRYIRELRERGEKVIGVNQNYEILVGK